MLLSDFKAVLKDGILKNSDNKTEKGRYTQLQTALNKLIKLDLIDDNSISQLTNSDELQKLLKNYEKALRKEGKDDCRGYLTRVRNLSKLYDEITNLKTEDMSFSEIMKEGLKRKYGSLDVFYQGEINADNHHEIKKKFKTYKQACMEIVKAGAFKHPELWPSVKIHDPNITKSEMANQLSSPSKNIRDWILGDSSPSPRINVGRLYFIEEYLLLPKGALANKVLITRNKPTNEKKQKREAARKNSKSQAKSSHHRHKKFVVKSLNKNFQTYYEEYSEYKLTGTQPVIRNITEKMLNHRRAEKKLKVRELKNGKETRWTAGADGSHQSLSQFYYSLRAFINFCVTEKNMKMEDVDVYHLTNFDILDSLEKHVTNGHMGASTAIDILRIVNTSARKKGYLRLCGSPGNRETEDYFEDLDDILEEMPIWISNIKPLIKSGDSGSYQGKENIQFLLDLDDADKIIDTCNKSSNILIQRSKSALSEADRLLSASKSKTDKVKDKFLREANTNISSAYYESMAAMFLSMSFINAPRAINLVTLKYYDSVQERDKNYASLTYHRKKNQYQLYIPKYGISPITEEETRIIKNAMIKGTVNIDVMMPETISPIISTFIKARDYYIKYKMKNSMPILIEDCINSIQHIKDGHFESFSKEENEMLLEVFELEKEALENFRESNIEALLPWCGKHQSLLKESDEYVRGLINSESWQTKKLTGRKFYLEKSYLGAQFKVKTENGFYLLDPELDQNGINPHGLRHLAAETYLLANPGHTAGAASIINDTKRQVDLTYGTEDRGRTMKRLAKNHA